MRNVEKVFKLAQKYLQKRKKVCKSVNFHLTLTYEEKERIFKNIMDAIREDALREESKKRLHVVHTR